MKRLVSPRFLLDLLGVTMKTGGYLMAILDTEREIERVPGEVSGRPIVRGTRILADAIADSFHPVETIQELSEGLPRSPWLSLKA
jgi:uncharacterized protein (DUF433 family)